MAIWYDVTRHRDTYLRTIDASRTLATISESVWNPHGVNAWWHDIRVGSMPPVFGLRPIHTMIATDWTGDCNDEAEPSSQHQHHVLCPQRSVSKITINMNTITIATKKNFSSWLRVHSYTTRIDHMHHCRSMHSSYLARRWIDSP
jgi:hypothetical protein